MFSKSEIEVARPIINGFEKVLLTGEYSKCIEFLNSQDQLKRIFRTYFDESKRGSQNEWAVQLEYKGDPERSKLYYMLILQGDNKYYRPWKILSAIYANSSLVHSYSSFYIYYEKAKNMMQEKEYERVRKKWGKLGYKCNERRLWIEAIYAFYQQYKMDKNSMQAFITELDYNINKLDNEAVLKFINADRLRADVRAFLKGNSDDEDYGNWIRAIINELNGEIDKAYDERMKEYKQHKNPMILVRNRNFHTPEYLDKLDAFLEEEYRANHALKSTKVRFEIIKLASSLDDRELREKVVAQACAEKLSGRILGEIFEGMNNEINRQAGIEIFKRFDSLSPLDYEVTKHYGKLLEEAGRFPEAKKVFEHMWLCCYSPNRKVEGIRTISLAALINSQPEYARSMFLKLNEVSTDIQKLSGIKESDSEDASELFNEVNRELQALFSLEDQVSILEQKGNTLIRDAFSSFCRSIGDYNFDGMLRCLISKAGVELLQFNETKWLVSMTASYKKKNYSLYIDIINLLFKLMEEKGNTENLAMLATCFSTAYTVLIRFIADSSENEFLKLKELFMKLREAGKGHITLEACIDYYINSRDENIKRFLVLLMTNFAKYTKAIDAIMSSNIDKVQKEEMTVKLCRVYSKDYNQSARFRRLLGYCLHECGFYGEAINYFKYAMDNLDDDLERKRTARQMYYICDLLIRMDSGIRIDAAMYTEVKDYFVKALRKITLEKAYSASLSNYLANYGNEDDSVNIIINIFKAYGNKEFGESEKYIEKLGRQDEGLYNECRLQLSKLEGLDNSSMENADLGSYEGQQAAYEHTAASSSVRSAHIGILEDEPDLEEEFEAEAEQAYEASYDREFDTQSKRDDIYDLGKVFETEDEPRKLAEILLSHTPVLAGKLSEYQPGETDITAEYKTRSSLIGSYTDNVEHISISERSKRSRVYLEAACLSFKLEMYTEFLKYLAEYCEIELMRINRDLPGFSDQAAIAYEAHLVWFAKYYYYNRHKLISCRADRGEEKLKSFHLYFFRAYAGMRDFSTLKHNLEYIKKLRMFLKGAGYRYIGIYQSKYRYRAGAILDNVCAFAEAAEKYTEASDYNEKKQLTENMAEYIENMYSSAKELVIKENANDINSFINNLEYLCAVEKEKLEDKPDISLKLLNHEELDTLEIENDDEELVYLTGFHFILENKGKRRAANLQYTFRIYKDRLLLKEYCSNGKLILREGEKLPIGFSHEFEEEGRYRLSVYVSYDEKTAASYNEPDFDYEIEVRKKEFIFDMITETYPADPIKKDADIPNKFFGRSRIIKQIQDGLDRNTYLIYGLRRIGKTSLLHYLRNMYKEKYRYRTIFIDCEAAKDALIDPSKLIYYFFMKRVADDLEIGLEVPSIDLFEEEPITRLSDFFHSAERKLGEDRLLLLIDEFDSLIEIIEKAREDISENGRKKYSVATGLLGTIRSFMLNSNNIKFIIAGSGYLLNRMGNEALKILDSTEPLSVGFLEKQEAKDMILRPNAGKIFYMNESVNRMLSVTKGHPFYIRAVGNKIINMLNNEGRRTVYPDDVDLIVKDLISDDSDTYFKHFWGYIDSSEKRLIVSVVAGCLDYYGDYINVEKDLLPKVKALIGELPAGLRDTLRTDSLEACVKELINGNVLTGKMVGSEVMVRISIEIWHKYTRTWKKTSTVVDELIKEARAKGVIANV